MLRGISPLIGPDLLATLCRMGHGDEIVLADAHFPGESLGPRVIRADGLAIPDLLAAILPLFALDTFVDAPAVMMAAVAGDTRDETLVARYAQEIEQHARDARIVDLERFDFYERARQAFAVVMTGETTKYANLILKKGVS